MVIPAEVGSANPVSSEGCLTINHSFHAVVNAIAHIHIETTRLTKERFVAGGAAAIAVAGGVVLGATCSAGWQKKDWGRCWEGVVAIGVA